MDDYNNQYKSLNNKYIICICPKCRTSHRKKMIWTGRGTPMKFCDICKHLAQSIEEIDEHNIGRMSRTSVTLHGGE